MARFVLIGRVDEAPENGNKAFEVEGRSILMCRTPLGVFAIANQCTHAESPLEGGRQRGASIFCPLHGARFDLRTGATAGQLTQTPVQTYPVEVRDEAVYVDLGAERP